MGILARATGMDQIVNVDLTGYLVEFRQME